MERFGEPVPAPSMPALAALPTTAAAATESASNSHHGLLIGVSPA
jgi:hypothetical protein